MTLPDDYNEHRADENGNCPVCTRRGLGHGPGGPNTPVPFGPNGCGAYETAQFLARRRPPRDMVQMLLRGLETTEDGAADPPTPKGGGRRPRRSPVQS